MHRLSPFFDSANFSRLSSKNDLAALRFFLRLGLTRRDPSDLPWLAARHSWLLPWRRRLDSADESLYASSALYRWRSYSRKRRRSRAPPTPRPANCEPRDTTHV